MMGLKIENVSKTYGDKKVVDSFIEAKPNRVLKSLR